MRVHHGLAVLALALPGLAGAFDYSFVEGGFVDIDRGRRDQGDAGLRVGGSFSVLPQLALTGEYADTGDFSQMSLGALYHTPLAPRWDLIAGGGLEFVDIGADDDAGFGLRGGARWQALDRLEVQPELRFVDVFEETSTSLRVSAAYEVVPRLDVQGAVQCGDDDRLEAGVRYRFGA